MPNLRTKQIIIKDFFYFYPYKKNISHNKNTTPDPYIKFEDVVDNHEYSLDYNVWKNIISDYINLIREDLMSGKKFIFPHRMGELRIIKFKSNRIVDVLKTKLTKKKTYMKNIMTDNFYVKLRWDKSYSITSVRFKYHWKISNDRSLLRNIYMRCDKDFNYINKFFSND